jgi:multiple sugar transport system ATP-binding protein
MAVVRLDALRKVYPNGQVAVADATLEIADGELLVLVGPSGCGKTTLLRMIAGLEPISSGTLSIGDRVVNDVPPKDRDIAMVFQNYALYPHMSVAENLGFGLRLRGQSRDAVAQRVHEVARLLEIEALLEARPSSLSGGQQQRVALGRALVRDPKVFLLDEPLSNLDARLRLSMRLEINRLHRRLGATTIYVTHDQIEAMTLGERIVVMDRGVVQQVDTPMHIYERPANVFVAGFFGTPAMNLLRGVLRIGADEFHLVMADGELHLGTPRQAERLHDWHEREVVLGVRPEDLQPVEAGHVSALRARVEVLEPVGGEAFLYLRQAAQGLVSRTAVHELPAPGETVALQIDPQRLHFFDAASGLRIGD